MKQRMNEPYEKGVAIRLAPSLAHRTANRPKLFFPLMCVKPRKSNVSGFPSPLCLIHRELDRRLAAARLWVDVWRKKWAQGEVVVCPSSP